MDHRQDANRLALRVVPPGVLVTQGVDLARQLRQVRLARTPRRRALIEESAPASRTSSRTASITAAVWWVLGAMRTSHDLPVDRYGRSMAPRFPIRTGSAARNPAPHALNDDATADRVNWLVERLGLDPIGPDALGAVGLPDQPSGF